MTIKIKQKITGIQVRNNNTEDESGAKPDDTEQHDNVVQMNEKLERPPMLQGSTYKIKTPLSEHALYLTINDIILNPGTEHELRRPFEVFINSKNMVHFQWIVALTRIMSAVFRKGGDVTFLVEELRSVFDPHGGYFKKGGKFMPSLVAEMGDVLENHLCSIGILKKAEPDAHQAQFIKGKAEEFAQKTATVDSEVEASSYPESAKLCNKCLTKAMIMLDGCLTCLSCGESKCG